MITSFNPPKIWIYPWVKEKTCPKPYNRTDFSNTESYVSSAHASAKGFPHYTDLGKYLQTDKVNGIDRFVNLCAGGTYLGGNEGYHRESDFRSR